MVMLGNDARANSRELAAVTDGTVASGGVRVLLLCPGPQSTPALDYGIRELGCSSSVVITASHSIRKYNDFKVFGSDGVQVTDVMAGAVPAKIELVDLSEVKTLPIDEEGAERL